MSLTKLDGPYTHDETSLVATSAKVYTYILVCYRIAITSRYMKAIYILPEIIDVQILEELGLG